MEQQQPNTPARSGRGWVLIEREIGPPNEVEWEWVRAEDLQSGEGRGPEPGGDGPAARGADLPPPLPAAPGWTPSRKVQFLEALAERGNVRRACAVVGISRAAAYLLRRRDAVFARGWAAAQVLGREVAIETLADRAVDGVSEPVFHRGEQVGTRVRYDSRLLLAHLGRLDRIVEQQADAVEDAGHFDHVLAQVAGLDPDPAWGERADHVDLAGEQAGLIHDATAPVPKDEAGEDSYAEARDLAVAMARAEAAADWDAQQAWLTEAVDALAAGQEPELEPEEEAAADPSGELEFKSLGQCQMCQAGAGEEPVAPQSAPALDPACVAAMVGATNEWRGTHHARYTGPRAGAAGADRLCRTGGDQAPGGQGAARRRGAADGPAGSAGAGGDMDTRRGRDGRGGGAGAVEPPECKAGALGAGRLGLAAGRALPGPLDAGLTNPNLTLRNAGPGQGPSLSHDRPRAVAHSCR